MDLSPHHNGRGSLNPSPVEATSGQKLGRPRPAIRKLLVGLTGLALAATTVLTVAGPAVADSSDTWTPPPPPADVVGAPASSVIAQVDQLAVSRTNFTNPEQSPSQATVSFDDQMTPGSALPAFTSGSTTSTLQNMRYPTVAGRFVGTNTEQVLAFQHFWDRENYGTWRLGSLTPPDSYSATAVTPKPGGFYAIATTVGKSLLSIGGNDTPLSYQGPVSGKAGLGQQWQVVPVDDDWVQLVNQADGYCLEVAGASKDAGAAIDTYGCLDGAQNEHWKLNSDGSLTNRASGLKLSTRNDHITQETTASVETAFRTIDSKGKLPTWTGFGDGDGENKAARGEAAPHTLTAGDLDRVTGTDAAYHDEAVAAYIDTDSRPRVRVFDYNTGDLTPRVTTLSDALPTTGGTLDGNYAFGSLNAAIGDFDGDTNNEIALTWQTTDHVFHASFLRYTADGDKRTLSVVAADVPLFNDKKWPTPLLISGVADLVAGDFDGSGRDSLALGYGATAAGRLDERPIGYIGVVRFAAADGNTLRPEAQQVTGLWGPDNRHELAVPNGQPWTQGGMALTSGFFKHDEANGFDLHRRQIAVAFPTLDRSGGDPHQLQTTVVQVSPTTKNGLDVGPLADPYYSTQSADGSDINTPVGLAAGGFAGLGGPDDLPLWGLAVTESSNRIAVLRVNGPKLEVASRLDTPLPSSTVRLTAYDPQGESLILGAPTVTTSTNLARADAVIAQPPAHADWLDNQFVNVTRKGELNVQVSSDKDNSYRSETKHTTGTTTGVSESSKWSVDAKLKVPFVEESAGLDIGQKMKKEWESESAESADRTHTSTVSMDTETNDDDIIKGSIKTTYIYQYPILNRPLTTADGKPVKDPSCPISCYGWYTVALPGPTRDVTGAGRDFDWYQPTWQNGNALSYPAVNGDPINHPDAGSYNFTDDNGKSVTRSGILMDTTNFIDGTRKTDTLKVTDSASQGHERTSKTTLANSADIKVTGGASVKAPGFKLNFKVEASSGYDRTDAAGDVATGSTETSNADTFKLNVPDTAANKAYAIRTIYYYDQTGAQRVTHGADLTSSNQGKDWWKTTYGRVADPALNLPNAVILKKTALEPELEWSSVPNRQLVRGFQVVDATTHQQMAENPVASHPVAFKVPVHNYSLVAAGQTTVKFLAVPVDTATQLDPIGEPETIGQINVSSIPAQGAVDAYSPGWTPEKAGPYRIFAVINPDSSTPEVHPLHGTPCPEESTDNEKALTDPMTGEEETLACGQNNQGYGTVTVSPNLAGAPTATKVALTGSSMIDPGNDNLQAPTAGGAVQAIVGKPLVGVLTAHADGISRTGQPVMVYDGNPVSGPVVATGTLSGVAGLQGGTATFTWTPKTPGRHVLHQVVLGRTADEPAQTRTVTVDVPAHGDPTGLGLALNLGTVKANHPTKAAVILHDAQGNRVADVTAMATLTITPDGTCAAGSCTPARTGPHTVTASHGTFTASAALKVITNPVVGVHPYSGDNQTAQAKTTFPRRLRAKVTDDLGHPLAGQNVTFTVARGPASFANKSATATVKSDRSGVATAPALIAGTSVGPVAVQASSGDVSTQFLAAVTSPSRTTADLKLDLKGPAKVHKNRAYRVKVVLTDRGPDNAGRTLVSVGLPAHTKVIKHPGGKHVGSLITYELTGPTKGHNKTFSLTLTSTTKGSRKITGAVISTSSDPHTRNNHDSLKTVTR